MDDLSFVALTEEDYEEMVADLEYLEALSLYLNHKLQEHGIHLEYTDDDIWKHAMQSDEGGTH